jgi:DNA repair exonuclease SbcCD ATPase subunit
MLMQSQQVLNKAAGVLQQFQLLAMQLEENSALVEQLKIKYQEVVKARDFLIDFSVFLKDQIRSKTEELANSALKCVFNDKVMSFKITPNQTKRGLQYDLYIETNGMLTPLQDCKGGGVLDVISLALLISFLVINTHKTARVLILDEPLKHLDASRLNNAISWLKGIAKEFQIQFIIVSHEDSIIENADKVIQCEIVDGVSSVV